MSDEGVDPRVLLVSGSTLFRQGLEQLFVSVRRWRVLPGEDTAKSGARRAMIELPELVVFDLTLAEAWKGGDRVLGQAYPCCFLTMPCGS